MVPQGSRVCSEHLLANDIDANINVDLTSRPPLKSLLPDRSAEIINDLLYICQAMPMMNSSPKQLQYASLSDEDIKSWTGWSASEFQQIHDAIAHQLGPCDSTYDALLLFWAKLKTNISWPQLSALCGLNKQKVSRTFHKVLNALNETLVPQYLGTQHLSRQEAISHNTIFTQTFYGDNVTLILDGTYIYIQKSDEHQFQRSSYCGQKKRNYLKFMSIVLPDGYVVDSIGPFFGSDNDAKITKQILTTVDDIKQWLQENDVIIVDRGFRDVLQLLKSAGYDPKMPSYLPKGQTQLTTESANEDRQCTKTRWVVESYHGRLKMWRIFREQLTSNYFVKVIKELVRITTACLNGIRGPIHKSTPDRALKDQLLASEMKSRMTLISPLAERVKSEPDLSRKANAVWKRLDAADIDFPLLDLEYLETVACGSYQIKQASGYIAEHFTDAGNYEVWAYNHSQDLIRGQIRSRHKSQTKYNVWVQFDAEDKANPVKDYFCQCPAGSRTVGMCTHTASILYYLGYVAHQGTASSLNQQRKKFRMSVLTESNV